MAKERILIVGSGWAGFNVSRGLDEDIYNIDIVSPETAFPYTPLLVSQSS
jgi:NADH dehydrogenase FAD-containing subunit